MREEARQNHESISRRDSEITLDDLGPPRAHIAAVAAVASLSALIAGHLVNKDASAAVALVCALARGAGAAATAPITLVALSLAAGFSGAIVALLLRPRGVFRAAAQGALLTFATTLWYPAYAETAVWWGLTPLEDQQMAGLIMWMPGGLVYAVAALILAGVWMVRAANMSERARYGVP